MTTLKKTHLSNVLRRVLEEDGCSVFYWRCFHQQYEDDPREKNYFDWTEEQRKAIRLGVNLGYLRLARQDDDHAEDDVPDGETVSVRLTEKGFDYRIQHGNSWWEEAVAQVYRNALTIFVAVAISLFGAWALHFLGPNQEIETTLTPMSGAKQ